MKRKDLINECKKIVKCDTARISKPMKTMFLVIGFNRNTKDDPGINLLNGQPVNWDYVQESVIASGKTAKELIESTKEYNRLCGISMEQYINELRSKKQP
jgi:hypothetical protein